MKHTPDELRHYLETMTPEAKKELENWGDLVKQIPGRVFKDLVPLEALLDRTIKELMAAAGRTLPHGQIEASFSAIFQLGFLCAKVGYSLGYSRGLDIELSLDEAIAIMQQGIIDHYAEADAEGN